MLIVHAENVHCDSVPCLSGYLPWKITPLQRELQTRLPKPPSMFSFMQNPVSVSGCVQNPRFPLLLFVINTLISLSVVASPSWSPAHLISALLCLFVAFIPPLPMLGQSLEQCGIGQHTFSFLTWSMRSAFPE